MVGPGKIPGILGGRAEHSVSALLDDCDRRLARLSHPVVMLPVPAATDSDSESEPDKPTLSHRCDFHSRRDVQPRHLGLVVLPTSLSPRKPSQGLPVST